MDEGVREDEGLVLGTGEELSIDHHICEYDRQQTLLEGNTFNAPVYETYSPATLFPAAPKPSLSSSTDKGHRARPLLRWFRLRVFAG